MDLCIVNFCLCTHSFLQRGGTEGRAEGRTRRGPVRGLTWRPGQAGKRTMIGVVCGDRRVDDAVVLVQEVLSKERGRGFRDDTNVHILQSIGLPS